MKVYSICMYENHSFYSIWLEGQITSAPCRPDIRQHPPASAHLHWCWRCFCEARFAGLSPWFAPVRGVGVGGGGLHFGLVRRALFIFAPRSTPNKLILTAVTLFSQSRVPAWPLAVAAEERQHAIPHCLGSRAAFHASLSPISTQ
jgi:hypothetical protein